MLNSLYNIFGLGASSKPAQGPKRILPWDTKSVSQARKDIQTWKRALALYQAEEPKSYLLQQLYDDITVDALLSSQMLNRKMPVLSAAFNLKTAAGKPDEKATDLLRNAPAYRAICTAAWESLLYGYSMVELSFAQDEARTLVVSAIPRTNIVPAKGFFFQDYSDDKKISYRDLPEYGTWLLEFDSGDLGLLNKAVPHVLFKRFAHSLWSEFGEIYGIPPRVLKTNTRDPQMMTRGKQMMKDMGAAAYFLIDEQESLEFAKGTAGEGEGFEKQMSFCDNQLSLLISGAVIGQDTKNGSRSKDESAQLMLRELVKSDMALLEQKWNGSILPALARIGFLPQGLVFEYEPAKDLAALWQMTKEVLPYAEIDWDWVKETFGVEVTGKKEASGTLGAGGFFD